MPNQNCVILAGHLARDPEIRFLNSGNAVVQFSIATNKEYEKNGEKKSIATFVECKAWGSVAERISDGFKKGDGITITGELTCESWEDKTTGQKRSRMLVTALSAASHSNTNPSTGAPAKSQPSLPVDDDPPF